jgi:hypothetical protein
VCATRLEAGRLFAEAGCFFAAAAFVAAGFLAAVVLDLVAADLAVMCAVRCALLAERA